MQSVYIYYIFYNYHLYHLNMYYIKFYLFLHQYQNIFVTVMIQNKINQFKKRKNIIYINIYTYIYIIIILGMK